MTSSSHYRVPSDPSSRQSEVRDERSSSGQVTERSSHGSLAYDPVFSLNGESVGSAFTPQSLKRPVYCNTPTYTLDACSHSYQRVTVTPASNYRRPLSPRTLYEKTLLANNHQNCPYWTKVKRQANNRMLYFRHLPAAHSNAMKEHASIASATERASSTFRGIKSVGIEGIHSPYCGCRNTL
ncbi:uncharacterized protein BYT42DRAFT_555498 [Radiomyces spectabilis]|uniref:uncharacterized protein n=1 Tax=Radiomyces spectabilis TaxID=64574 RepID=UPI00221F685E|nr:uncharacterized protein BYT42DRAFT_555498 [Radiomyces spectabilis]KAI8391077.1 hypothetical protein BYT42DRAFT_555498 [Radiomyces spectabilis]